MNIFPKLNRPTIVVEPKIYGMLLEFPETNFLSVQIAYSLEEAFIKAKDEMEILERTMFKKGPLNQTFGHAKISLFSCKTIEELEKGSFNYIQENYIPEEQIKKTIDTIQSFKERKSKVVPKKRKSKSEEKNKLMKQIIDNKDEILLKENSSLFTKAEIDYIKEHIK